MDELLQQLGLKRTPKLLRQALTHPSAVGKGIERIEKSNQRLEFLGDALLGSVIAAYLFRENPLLNEGELTLRKIAIVRKESLASAARRLNLGKYIILSPHEEAVGGRERDSILADTLEAVIGAIYLSFGHKRSAEIIIKVLLPEINQTTAKPRSLASSKNMLQEKTQAAGMGTPTYQTQPHTTGEKLFHSSVFANGEKLGEGEGSSKKAAESAAATVAMQNFA